MSDSNDLVMAALLRIEGTVATAAAETKASNARLDALIGAFKDHIRDDKEVEKRVVALEGTASRAKWMLGGIGLVLTGFWKLIELYFTRTH